jgi:hypothetical protein
MSFNKFSILVSLLCTSAFAADCGRAGQCEEDEVSLVQVKRILKKGDPYIMDMPLDESLEGPVAPVVAAADDQLFKDGNADKGDNLATSVAGFEAMIGEPGLPVPSPAVPQLNDLDLFPGLGTSWPKSDKAEDHSVADGNGDPFDDIFSGLQVGSSTEQEAAAPPLGRDKGFGGRELRQIDGKKVTAFGDRDVRTFEKAHPWGLRELGRGKDGLGTPQFGNKNLRTMPKAYGLKEIRAFVKAHPWGAKSLRPFNEWGLKETARTLAKTSIGARDLRQAGTGWGLKELRKAAATVKSMQLPDGTVPGIDGDVDQLMSVEQYDGIDGDVGLDGAGLAAGEFMAKDGLNAYPNSDSATLSLQNDATNYFGDDAMTLKGYNVGMAAEVGESQAQAAKNEHEFVNSLALEARDDAASAKELLNGMAARTQQYVADVADVAKVQGAELMADAHEQAAAEVFTTAVANRDRAEENQARELELANAVNLDDARTRADDALVRDEEADGYADTLREANADRVVTAAEARNLVNNAAKEVNAQTAEEKEYLAILKEAQNANKAYANEELSSAETASMADTREAAAKSVAQETEELTTDVRAAAAQKVADQVAAANERKAEFADMEAMRKAAAAARDEERANDWKVEQAYDQYEASDVADTEKMAVARVKANARQVAEARADYVADARDIAGQVAGLNSQRKADVAAAVKAESAENSALVGDAQQLSQAEAAQWKGEAASAQQYEAANAKDMQADVAAAAAQRASDRQQAASVLKSDLSFSDQATRALIADGAQDVSAANAYAQDDLSAGQKFGSEATDYAKANAADIAAALKAENADTVAAEGQIATLNSADWASDATTAEQSDLANVASAVSYAKTANAADAADAAEASDDVLLGTKARGFYDTGYGAAFEAGLSGYGAGLGAAGYGSIAGGAARADALAGAMNDATASATGLVDSGDWNYPDSLSPLGSGLV